MQRTSSGSRSPITRRSISQKRLLFKLFPALSDEQRPIDGDVPPGLLLSGWPAHLDLIGFIGFADAEIKRECALRVVATATHDVGDLFTAVRFLRASRADGAAVRPRPLQRYSNICHAQAGFLYHRWPIAY